MKTIGNLLLKPQEEGPEQRTLLSPDLFVTYRNKDSWYQEISFFMLKTGEKGEKTNISRKKKN